MPEANKIIDILQSERPFGRVVREIQINFRCSEIAHVTRQNMMSLKDYVEFLKRTKWKTYNKKGGRQIYGNYLTVIV
jgi:hypothetical protein